MNKKVVHLVEGWMKPRCGWTRGTCFWLHFGERSITFLVADIIWLKRIAKHPAPF